MANALAIAVHAHCEQVESIYVFGSVARREATESSDIDLIFTVDDTLFRAWLNICLQTNEDEQGDESMYFGLPARIRMDVAREMIPDFGYLMQHVSFELQGNIDVLLLPVDWQQRLDELQYRGHSDPQFMRNISKDALLLMTRKTGVPVTA